MTYEELECESNCFGLAVVNNSDSLATRVRELISDFANRNTDFYTLYRRFSQAIYSCMPKEECNTFKCMTVPQRFLVLRHAAIYYNDSVPDNGELQKHFDTALIKRLGSTRSATIRGAEHKLTLLNYFCIQPQPQPEEEHMNDKNQGYITGNDCDRNCAPIIETKTFIFGTDIDKLTDSQLYSKIADVEAEIDRLEAIRTKPAKLVKQLEEMKTAVVAVAAAIDART